MGFRDYSPGLNRFTTRDMYNGALADMGLGTDPYTGNRYAFTGGNPISLIELDRHEWWNPASWFSDGGKTSTKPSAKGGGGWLTIGQVFLDAIGWNTSTAPSGYESEPGDRPDYDKGLLVTPQKEESGLPALTRSRLTGGIVARARARSSTSRWTLRAAPPV
jgi:hypothetical protein